MARRFEVQQVPLAGEFCVGHVLERDVTCHMALFGEWPAKWRTGGSEMRPLKGVL